jgi:hypothetical protein
MTCPVVGGDLGPDDLVMAQRGGPFDLGEEDVRLRESANVHARDRARDHELLDLLGAFEPAFRTSR